MEMKVYVEDLQIVQELGYYSTPATLEEECKEAGFFFSQDDMGNCYISKTKDCEVFEEVEF